ncbi:MAG: hypothetical protein II587_04755, partial [Oscillospiraceae bacterium]|nr:hypothetical protein [Oscillospiraceae bacterium]
LYSYDKLEKCCDKLCAVCRKVTEGPCAEQFKKHVGKDAFDVFAEYEPMSKREKELTKKEKKLVDEYYDVIEEAEKATYTYKGEDWDFDRINSDEGAELSMSDYEGYVEIFDGLQKIANDSAGPILTRRMRRPPRSRA